MNRNDELMHYGVLGMKWGQRRVRVNQAKAAKAKAKGNKAAADKYSAKADRLEKKHTKLAGGKKAYNYTKNQSTGKALAKSYLMGTYGAMKYNQARAAGEGRGKAAIKGTLYNVGNQFTSGALSVAEPRMSYTAKHPAQTVKTGARAIKNQAKKKKNK